MGVGTDLFQIEGGGCPIQIVQRGIFRQVDETMGFDELQGTLDTFFTGVKILADHLHTTHRTLQVGILLQLLQQYSFDL